MLKIELMSGQVQQNIQNMVKLLQFSQIQMNSIQDICVFWTGKRRLL